MKAKAAKIKIHMYEREKIKKKNKLTDLSVLGVSDDSNP